MSFDNVYESLNEDNDIRWAFGTGFADPLSGVDTTVPPGVTADECLALGDDALIMSHRLQEWITRAPELEDEVALANIGLDLLGQARLLLTRAGQIDGTGRGEDDFAFLRDEREFRNVRLAELDGGHFGHLVARLFVFSAWRLAVFGGLLDAVDPVLAAIAAKAVKELAYHREYAAGWVVRLGDGTALSHDRMQEGLDATWPYVAELFDGADRAEFDDVVGQVLDAATLTVPDVPSVGGPGGRDGVHTERMGFLLAE
ncbi:MAG TPA: 1,2-phenylacetyl-CoA epoxidase subunit PaaC, partial [Pseudonocardiaceae bacterium]|nr:1,2-phenylacetyl-CoA epoxidase subunit PaaC [Pseudonocardiaceae bacterium]